MLDELGFDDVVIVTKNHASDHLRAIRKLVR
ncbi:MAG: hypothetical protein ACI91O_000014 [Candidatus Poriferisodalaceae bacterium]|jgi:hypothetical protein